MKYKSSRKDKTEAPSTSPSQPPILAENEQKNIYFFD
jgi:hypothetical protein